MKIRNEKRIELIYYNVMLFLLFMYSLAYKGEILLYSLGIIGLISFKIILEKKIKINIELFLFLMFIILLYFTSRIQSELNLLNNCICWLIMYLTGQEVILKKGSEDKKIKILKNLLLAIGFGFFTHAFLTTYYGVITLNGRDFVDYWMKNKIATTQIAATQIAAWCSILVGTLPYFILQNKNKNNYYKFLNLIVFIFIFLVTSKLGSRTILYIIFLNLLYIFLSIKKYRKIKLILNLITLIIIVYFLYTNDVFLIKTTLENSQLYLRMIIRKQANVLQSARSYRQIYFITNMDRAFFGKNIIYKEVGGYMHNFWLDIFDAFGVITFVFLFIFTCLTIKNFIKIYFNNRINFNFKVLLTGIFISLFLQLSVEPTFSYGYYNFVGAFFFLTGVINNFKKEK